MSPYMGVFLEVFTHMGAFAIPYSLVCKILSKQHENVARYGRSDMMPFKDQHCVCFELTTLRLDYDNLGPFCRTATHLELFSHLFIS